MADEMKSAYDRAMERIKSLEEPSKEEVLTWKYVPEGQKLAVRFLKEEFNLATELGKFKDEERRYVAKGAEEVLLRNIVLPVHDIAKKNNKRAMDAVKAIKKDKTAVENVFTKMRRVFDHYTGEGEQQRRQAYEMLKQDFQAKLQQAMRQQGIPPGTKINIEGQPQFQEEWHLTLAQMDAQYNQLLDEYKQEITNLR
ncbi:MAG TPA: hypothetical protein VN415_02300 [Dehalococcoidia bacterium]|nr:hypothetical protein [Dehalococcoidia bacterium]